MATAGGLVQWHPHLHVTTTDGGRVPDGRWHPLMSVVGFLTDSFPIRRILDHLGLSLSLQDKPPPIREVLRVAERSEGWRVPAHWE